MHKKLSVFLVGTSLFLSVAACSSNTKPSASPPAMADTVKMKLTAEETDTLSAERLLGKINPSKEENFVRIPPQYTDKSNIYLHKDAYQAFLRMAEAAAAEGFFLQIISATRTFADQKRIWENKWTGKQKVEGQDLSQTIPDPAQRAMKILEYSSMPGTSRHHWGTDIDLNALNNSYFASGKGLKIYEWMQQHAPSYGFCQVYTEKGPARPHGYNEEKWHWSYIPLAADLLTHYARQISYQDISGFKGAEVAEKINMIPNYVQGIAPACKDWKEE